MRGFWDVTPLFWWETLQSYFIYSTDPCTWFSFHQINYFLAVNKTLKSISYIINVSGIADMKLNLSSFSHFNFSTFTLFSQKKQSLVFYWWLTRWFCWLPCKLSLWSVLQCMSFLVTKLCALTIKLNSWWKMLIWCVTWSKSAEKDYIATHNMRNHCVIW